VSETIKNAAASNDVIVVSLTNHFSTGRSVAHQIISHRRSFAERDTTGVLTTGD
jgi:hypothetical protein